jgi:hypothetical protein
MSFIEAPEQPSSSKPLPRAHVDVAADRASVVPAVVFLDLALTEADGVCGGGESGAQRVRRVVATDGGVVRETAHNARDRARADAGLEHPRALDEP